MKVLLVNPISRNTSLSSPDLGLGYLAASLKKDHHHVEILDCVNLRLNFKTFEKYIAGNDFDVIGFRVFSTDLLSVKKSLQIVKNKRPDAVIILGGAHPSSFPEQTLQYFEEADFAIGGEAEAGLTALINNVPDPAREQKEKIPGLIWRKNGNIEINPALFQEDLDALGLPDWNLINPLHYPFQTSYFLKSKIVAPLIMTRGCPYHCTFCSCRSVTGHKIRNHSVTYIVDQIKFLKANFGIKEVCFIDDNFLALKPLIIDLCRQLIKDKTDVQWSCFGIRLDLVDKETVMLMEKAGCYLITVGIESGSQRILNHMKKHLTLDVIKEKTSVIHNNTNIKIIGNFILGYPLEEEKDMHETIRLAKNLPLHAANFFPFHPTPGTEIFDDFIAKQEGEAIHWNTMGQDRIPYVPQGISRQKFTWLFFLAFINFYLRPEAMLNLLSSIRSLDRLKYILYRIFRIIQ